MKDYRKKSALLIIFICSLLAGVCFENIKADAFSVASSVCGIEQADEFEQESFSDTEPCAAVKSNTQSMRIQKTLQSSTKKIELKLLSLYLCINSDFPGGKNASGNIKKLSDGQRMPKEIMTNYIHQSDGKKRI